MSVYLRSFVFAAALAAAAGGFAEEAGSSRGVSYEEAAGMPVPAACVKTVTEDSVALEGVGCFEGSDTDLRALTLQFDAEGRLSRLEARMIEGEGFRALAEAGFETHMIPGVPSFCAAAARLDISLTTAKKPLVIIPGDAESMDALLEIDGTKVLMKSGRSIADTVKKLENLNLANGARAVENCGMENERVIRDVRKLTSGAGYFTTIIIKGAD